MKRIGIAASKLAQGNLVLYNAWVIGLTLILTVVLLVLAGIPTFVALTLMGHALEAFFPDSFGPQWTEVVQVSMAAVIMLVLGLAGAGLFQNMIFTKDLKK